MPSDTRAVIFLKSSGVISPPRAPLESRRRNVILGLAFFALSPIPSAQLFEAAGLSGVRLLGFTAAFFIGRTVSYSIYPASAKHVRESSIGDAFANVLASPWGIGLQVVMIGLLVTLAQIDWQRVLRRNRDRDDANHPAA